MVKNVRLVALAGLGVLAACARPVDDPLAANSIYWGLEPMPVYRGELPRVLFSAADTPAKQGLLYTAMVDAEVAAQHAGRALAAEDQTLARGALGEVLYAIDPDTAPAWEAKSAGIVRGWAGTGYGLQRAAAGIADEIRTAAEADGSAALADYGLPVVRCVDNTLERSGQIVLLSRAALDAAALEAQLQQIQALANQLNQGAPGAADSGVVAADCGLQHTQRSLDRLRPNRG